MPTDAEILQEKNERNARVQRRYNDLMKEGRHGHYETLFRVVREEIEAAARRDAEEIARLRTKIEKVVAWLEKLAARSEACAKDIPFITLAEAHAADAKNYRATIANIRAALASPAPDAFVWAKRERDSGWPELDDDAAGPPEGIK